MNQARFEEGRAAELALQSHYRRTYHVVLDLGIPPPDQNWTFPRALHWNGSLILPDMLVMRDGYGCYVECKVKAPTPYGCFSIGVKQLEDARAIAAESGMHYAFVVQNTLVEAKNDGDLDPWLVTFPFNEDWLRPNELQRYGKSYFIPLSAFQPLKPTLKYGPPSAVCLI